MEEGAECQRPRLFVNRQLRLCRMGAGLAWILCWVQGDPQPHRAQRCWVAGRMAASSCVAGEVGHT